MSHYHREAPPRRYGYERRDRRLGDAPLRSSSRSSRSRSPDPALTRYLAEQAQARPSSPSLEEHRRQRIAAGGVFNVKSRHERERDEAERKKREEDENAAKAFREFVADMEGAGGSRNARPRDVRPAYGRNYVSGFVQAGGSAYDPQRRQPQQIPEVSGSSSTAGHTAAQKAAVFDDGADEEEDVRKKEREHESKREPPGKRKGAMHDFLDELQRNQAEREDRLRAHITETTSISSLLAAEMKPAAGRPRDEKDASSSNICILNLPADVSELSFGEYFSQYGDVGSVKIMWPKIEDTIPLPSSVRTTKHAGATGFINYMRRSDAQVAYKAMDGAQWGGCEIHTAWGKSLPKPHVPLHLRSDYERHHRQGSRPGGGAPRDRKRRSSRSPASRNHRRRREGSPRARDVLRNLLLEQDQGADTEQTIMAVASRVREYGARFENMVREREMDNPQYAFLEPGDSIEHQYYRCVIDDSYTPVLPVTPFTEEGDASLYSSDTEEDSEWERLRSDGRQNALGKAATLRLDAMLRGLTLRRERIARLMVFAIDHASAAEAVVDRLVGSTLLPTTPLPRKLARLYVISDILHNLTNSGAWRYRSLFEARLDTVFAHWGDVASSFPGRIKREACRDMARSVLAVWDTWLVFESPRLAEWRTYVDQGSGQQRTPSPDDQAEDQHAKIDHIDRAASQPESADDIDGDAMMDDSDIDGEALDGEAMIDGDDIDGEVLNSRPTSKEVSGPNVDGAESM